MKRLLTKIVSVILLISIYTSYKLQQKHQVNQQLLIKKGTSTFEIAKKLKEKNIIDFPLLFVVYSKIKGNSLKAGYYEFKGEMSIIDIYQILKEGLVKEYIFTIVPGDNLFNIGSKLEAEGIVSKEEFLKYSFNKENLKRFNLEGESFEGYFPPETYYIPYRATLEDIIKIFLDVFKKRYMPYKEKFNKKQINFYQGMIIASMIEKEAYLEEEKPKIAGVIFNRLAKNMRLQIDATVIYALMLENRYNGKLRKEDMKISSPFNTYITKGLPPTPICSFSLSSLEAVLFPETHNYLYYVLSKDRKSHIFSHDYKEHLKNIDIHLKSK